MTQALPGWYTDPEPQAPADRQRWWDGVRWGNMTIPHGGKPADSKWAAPAPRPEQNLDIPEPGEMDDNGVTVPLGPEYLTGDPDTTMRLPPVPPGPGPATGTGPPASAPPPTTAEPKPPTPGAGLGNRRYDAPPPFGQTPVGGRDAKPPAGARRPKQGGGGLLLFVQFVVLCALAYGAWWLVWGRR
jgi:hypothetical protein